VQTCLRHRTGQQVANLVGWIRKFDEIVEKNRVPSTRAEALAATRSLALSLREHAQEWEQETEPPALAAEARRLGEAVELTLAVF